MFGALNNVPPLENLVKHWSRQKRPLIGEGLLRRVVETALISCEIDPVICLESAIGDFGMSDHAVSTYLLSALTGMKEERVRTSKLKEELRVDEETQKKGIEDAKAEFDKNIADLQGQIESAKSVVVKKNKDFERARAEVRKQLNAVEKNLSDETETRRKLVVDLKTSEAGRIEAEKIAKNAAKRIDSMEKELAAAAVKTQAAKDKTVSAVEEYKNSDDYWKPVMACYDQGFYHAVRCYRRAAELNLPMTIEEIATWPSADMFEDNLTTYHPVIIYAEQNIIEHNLKLKDKGFLEWVAPQVNEVNLRTLQDQFENPTKELDDMETLDEKTPVET